MTRTLPWTTSWACTRKRPATTGAPPTSPSIPTSSIPWRSTTDRYTHQASFSLLSVSYISLSVSYVFFNRVVTWQDEEAVKRLTATAGTKSKLAKPIQDLIKMIFDVESMKKAMVEFEVGLSILHASLSSNLLHPASNHTLET